MDTAFELKIKDKMPAMQYSVLEHHRECCPPKKVYLACDMQSGIVFGVFTTIEAVRKASGLETVLEFELDKEDRGRYPQE
jgi:hypothetical protein